MTDTAKNLNDDKKPWLAGILNVVIPGLGHIYLKDWERGIATFITILLLLFIRPIFLLLMAFANIDCANVSLIVLVGALFFDGFNAAVKHNKLSAES